jgi:hypothetical protein
MKPIALIAALVLAATPVLASSDLVMTIETPSATIRAGKSSVVYFYVRNSGPDAATAVTIAVSSSVPGTCNCTFGDIPSGQLRVGNVSFVAPPANGPVTFSITASSNAPDSNPADNTASVTLNVSADPDVFLSVNTPLVQDLGLPFPFTIYLGNNTITTAHDLETTIDFRSDVVVKSLPSGCSSIATGRILCRLDSLPPTIPAVPAFTLSLIAPTSYGFGSINFTTVVTEREHDFDPISNIATREIALYKTFYVTKTSNDGAGSLRQAILDANAAAGGPLAIAFKIEEPSSTTWKTIRISTPLPQINGGIRVDGATQRGFFGDQNPAGPEIEIRGENNVDGDGLVVTHCGAEIANLAIDSFRRNGVSVIEATCGPYPITELHDLFIGTDPTGSEARPNGRGIGMSVMNGTYIFSARGTTNIHDCVLSGNALSGLFALSGRLDAWGNRIGVKAHSDEPLPNGASGIFVGPGGYGSQIGPDTFTFQRAPNVIAFNREMGVAVAAGVGDVSVRGNRIWGNGTLGIDIGLDGPTLSTRNQFDVPIAVPQLTLAHYDPVSKKTMIEGEVGVTIGAVRSFVADLYANDAFDPSGFGEGQRPIARTQSTAFITPTHFRVAVDGDLTGQFITATTTRTNYVGFAKPEGLDQLFLTQTSEFGRAIEVR